MDEQQAKVQKTILWVGGPLVVVFLLTQIGSTDGLTLTAMLIVGVPALLLFLVLRALIRVGDKRPAPVQFAPPPQAPTVAAGWYPDQVDPSLVRWFDGQQWTGATLPRQY